MKKTFITLLALAGVAMAETNLAYSQYSDNLKEGLLFAYSFDNGASADYTATGVSLSGTFTREDNAGTCTGDAPVKSSSLTLTGDFTLSFYLVDATMGNNTALVALYSDTTSTGRNNCIMLTKNSKEYMNLSCLGFAGSEWTHPYDDQQLAADAAGQVMTLTWDSSAAQITYYINEEKVAQETLSEKAQNATALNLTFATANGDNKATSVTLDNIAMWNRVLTADEIKTVATMVPEPTTATLSLLALAGLAARRRRR